MRVLGYLSVGGGVAILGLAILLLTQSAFDRGILGAVVMGCVAVICGINLILQSEGLMD